MQVLSETTNQSPSEHPVSAEKFAQEILDGVPEVMWTLRCHMRKRRAKGLSVPQFRALYWIKQSPGDTLSSVADHLGSTLPTASRIVGGLVTRGLISRKTGSDDRRQVSLEITAKGKSILDFAREGTEAAIAEKLIHLSPKQRATMSSALAEMVSVLGRCKNDSSGVRPS